ncbi:MAG: aminotransferase class V-fold PLP-dependent enzyme [Xanthomonadales bacterium]|nr:aminotransferase class V-fold PLP-dependent enzyme [Xanthomonadales bacterium]
MPVRDSSRRRFLGGIAAGTALAASGVGHAGKAVARPTPPIGASPDELARDEAFWREVGAFYDRTKGVLNLEHGYWGKMARPVQDAYLDALRMVNAQNSFYARKDYAADEAESVHRIARALGAHDDEVVITRNATEACHNVIRQYRGLGKGDAVLIADIDYPHFKSHMHWLGDGRGVRVVEIEIPTRANQVDIRKLYQKAFESNPDLKLMLITHVSNQHGLVVPVAEVAAEARGRGIDVVCDAAQSWGLLDYKVADLGVDWVAFNLHKWIGAPVGTGALYMRRGSLGKVAPYPGDGGTEDMNVAKRVHPGTYNFAARLAIPAALDFHESIGTANKEARLRYLRSLWTDEAQHMPHLEVLGGKDEESWTGIGSFRLAGQTTIEEATKLQQRLETEFGIFSVVRKGLASGGCVRITPQVFNSADEIGRLVDALRDLAKSAISA